MEGWGWGRIAGQAKCWPGSACSVPDVTSSRDPGEGSIKQVHGNSGHNLCAERNLIVSALHSF